MAKAIYKTDLPKDSEWRGQKVGDGGSVELDVLAENKDGSVNLGSKGELVVGSCKKGSAVGNCVVVEQPKKEK